MSSLLDQHNAFKKRLAAQPIIKKQPLPNSHPSKNAVDNGRKRPNAVDQDMLNLINKRPKKSTSTLSGSNAVSSRHTSSLVYDTINYLKSAPPSQTLDDLRAHVGVDLNQNPDLLQMLKNSTKVEYDPIAMTFSYKPTYNIKSKGDILRLLKQKRDQGGIEVRELQDTNLNITPMIEELIDNNQVLVIKGKDDKPKVLFHNDSDVRIDMDPEFITMWQELKCPDHLDLAAELEKAGLKTMEVFSDKPAQSQSKTKKPKQRNRKVKITNTHLEGIDLTKDYLTGL